MMVSSLLGTGTSEKSSVSQFDKGFVRVSQCCPLQPGLQLKCQKRHVCWLLPLTNSFSIVTVWGCPFFNHMTHTY